MSCIFCKILSGDLEASIVYRDELCTAFMDVQPVNLGHLLVVPNAHAEFLSDLPPETGAQIFRVAQQMTAALRKSGLPCEGVNLFLADGEVAMQEVFHVHLHVFPRCMGDGFGLTYAPKYFQKPARTELDDAAKAIRAAHPVQGR